MAMGFFCHPLGDGFLVIRSRHLSSLLLQPTWGLSHKSQLFWCELQGYKVLTHCHLGKPPCVFVFPLLKSCTSGMNIKLILGRGWCDIQHNYERLRAKQWTICRVIERQLDSRDFQNSTVLQQIILSVAIHWVLWLLVLKEWPFFLHVQTASAWSPFGSLKTPAQHTLTMLNPKPIGLNYIYIYPLVNVT